MNPLDEWIRTLNRVDLVVHHFEYLGDSRSTWPVALEAGFPPMAHNGRFELSLSVHLKLPYDTKATIIHRDWCIVGETTFDPYVPSDAVMYWAFTTQYDILTKQSACKICHLPWPISLVDAVKGRRP